MARSGDYYYYYYNHYTQVGGLLDNKGYGIGLPPSKIHLNHQNVNSLKIVNCHEQIFLKKDFVGQCDDFSADKIVLEFDYKGCRIGLPPTKLIGILETERILI